MRPTAAVALLFLLSSPTARAADSGVTARLDAWLTAPGYSGSALVV